MAFPSTSSVAYPRSLSPLRRCPGFLALLVAVLLFLSFQLVIHVPSIRLAVSGWLFSDHQTERKGPGSCPGCHNGMDNADKTIAYTNQDGRIRLFKVTTREFLSSSIWKNPLLPKDTEPVAETQEIAEEQLLATGSEVSNLSSTETLETRTDPIKLKREVFRRKRKEHRIQELLQVDKEAELHMRNVATNRSRNFSNKVRASYNIWRLQFHHTNTDSTLRLMKHQIIMAKVYATIAHSQKQPDMYALLMKCIKLCQEAIGDAHMDYELDSSALERAKAMGHALSSARDVLYNSDEVSRRLLVMLQSTELNIDSVKKQNSFLVQHAAKTVPMPLHCLHMQLTTDYYFRDGTIKEYFHDAVLKEEEDKAKREDRSLYHYAIFSDNVLAASVVVRSTVTHAKEPEKHVFHIVTDRLNFAAMTMWFIRHPPLPATVHVENIDNFKWLNSSYCSVLRQLESARLKEYYFKAHDPSSLSDGNENLKYRNPKYLSMLNHLRFYMPEIHPKLDKILFLDDDVVVQKDLTPLWDVDLKGMVNGAVETCKESFHRFDTYLNFSHPKIAENFDPRACGWAFGMNMFDLKEWKKQNITGIYHYWQDLNEDRKLWKLGTLPPGLITFYNLTYPLNRNWHVLGLGYDPAVDLAEIENAAVVHYNGNYKPWLDLAVSKYKPYWSKYVDLDNSHIQHCYMSEQ
ncbi:probable galacturonosyltransferase 3 [Oryza glaberrima]|uniref:Hexosyltransferase n=1 Tax=Oryza barthii TaxID=65489 RepID=A0A0D3HCS0_9ORYZ|nr:probable galacturonosyltransferase 3 [Oryza glaberrima]